MSLLYFINCNGSGHWQKACAILDHINTTTIVVAQNKPDHITLAPRHHFISIEPLRNTDDTDFASDAIHIKQYNQRVYFSRIQKLIDIIDAFNVRYAILDVSVDLAMLMRLLDIPYIHFKLHGIRNDAAHHQAYYAADRLLAVYPEELEQSDTTSWISNKTKYVGGIINLPIVKQEFLISSQKRPIILFIKPKGYSSLTVSYLMNLAVDIPEYLWYGIGFEEEKSGDNFHIETFNPNPAYLYYKADIIVCVAGDNSILEAGYLNKPLITKAEQRYFFEQECKVKVLREKKLAVVLDEWYENPEAWQRLIEETKQLNSWNNIVADDGALHAAKFIEERYSFYVSAS